jgi:hypothetical protein
MLINILIGLLIIGIVYLLYHQGKLYEELNRLDRDIEQLYNEQQETMIFTMEEDD